MVIVDTPHKELQQIFMYDSLPPLRGCSVITILLYTKHEPSEHRQEGII